MFTNGSCSLQLFPRDLVRGASVCVEVERGWRRERSGGRRRGQRVINSAFAALMSPNIFPRSTKSLCVCETRFRPNTDSISSTCLCYLLTLLLLLFLSLLNRLNSSSCLTPPPSCWRRGFSFSATAVTHVDAVAQAVQLLEADWPTTVRWAGLRAGWAGWEDLLTTGNPSHRREGANLSPRHFFLVHFHRLKHQADTRCPVGGAVEAKGLTAAMRRLDPPGQSG